MVRTPRFHCYALGSVPGQGTKALQAARHGPKKKDYGLHEEAASGCLCSFDEFQK